MERVLAKIGGRIGTMMIVSLRLNNGIFLGLLFFWLAEPSTGWGQAFVDKGFSARATSLGRSAVSLVNDPALLWYNPASAATGERISVSSSYSRLYPDIADANLNFLAFSGIYPLRGIGAVGLGVTQFSPAGWSENVFAALFSTHLISDDLSLGGNLKFLRWSAEAPKGENAVPEPALTYSGLSVDIGVLYVLHDLLENNDVRLGFSLLDINRPSVASDGASDAKLPLGLNGGASYVSYTYHYALSTQLSVRGRNDVRISGGFEVVGLQPSLFGVEGTFLIRIGGGRTVGGATNFQGDYNGGFGLAVSGLSIDYSYTAQIGVLNVGGINSLTLGYVF